MKKIIFKALIIISCLLTISSCCSFYTDDTYLVVHIKPDYIIAQGKNNMANIMIQGKDLAASAKLGDTIKIQRYGKAN